MNLQLINLIPVPRMALKQLRYVLATFQWLGQAENMGVAAPGLPDNPGFFVPWTLRCFSASACRIDPEPVASAWPGAPVLDRHGRCLAHRLRPCADHGHVPGMTLACSWICPTQTWDLRCGLTAGPGTAA